MPSEGITDANAANIVRQMLADNDGFWERVKHKIVHDPTHSPFEKAMLIGAGVAYFRDCLNAY